MAKDFARSCVFVVLACASFTVFAGGVQSDGLSQLEEGWRFAAAPYFWFGEISGNLTVAQNKRSVSVPFSKIFSNGNLSYFVNLSASYGPFSIVLSPAYIPLFKGSSPEIKSDIVNLDGALYYRFYSRYTPNNYYLSLDLMGGVRYFDVDSTVYLPNRAVSASDSMVAPMLGLRFKVEFSSKLNFWMLGDAGGFGVDNLNSTWGVNVGLSYLVHKYIRVAVAYKLLKLDYDTPSSAFNGLIYGPMVGVTFSSNSYE